MTFKDALKERASEIQIPTLGILLPHIQTALRELAEGKNPRVRTLVWREMLLAKIDRYVTADGHEIQFVNAETSCYGVKTLYLTGRPGPSRDEHGRVYVDFAGWAK